MASGSSATRPLSWCLTSLGDTSSRSPLLQQHPLLKLQTAHSRAVQQWQQLTTQSLKWPGVQRVVLVGRMILRCRWQWVGRGVQRL